MVPFPDMSQLGKTIYTEVHIDSHEFWYPIGEKFDLQIYETYHQ